MNAIFLFFNDTTIVSFDAVGSKKSYCVFLFFNCQLELFFRLTMEFIL